MRILLALLLAVTALTGIAAPALTQDGFELPTVGRHFEFPKDHGSHPTFKIEWWYLTGHLEARGGRQFGFQATFFRRAFRETDNGPLNHIHLAHMALTDLRGDRFFHQERLARDGWDAEATVGDLSVRNGPWTLRRESSAGRDTFIVEGGIKADVSFAFTLSPKKPLVVFGENGVSRKGSDPTAASHYLTFTRMGVTGDLHLPEGTLDVTGEAWMDHEFSSSQLSEGMVGWDWAGIHLDDGREVMVYRLRFKDGTQDPASRLTWVDKSGELTTRPFSWRVERTWKSAATGVEYPAVVAIDTVDPQTGTGITLRLTPKREDQELIGNRGGVTYWEGACAVESTPKSLTGKAYMELTGYAGQLRM
ncbi:MAG: lipocalin-like domain-containing protein [Opitutaceae bacterium]|nr:lipocalin-like domain-containing protein [Opitutaceae bacterium]